MNFYVGKFYFSGYNRYYNHFYFILLFPFKIWLTFLIVSLSSNGTRLIFHRSGRTRGRLCWLHGRSAQVPTRSGRISRRASRGPRTPQPSRSVTAKAHGPSVNVTSLNFEEVEKFLIHNNINVLLSCKEKRIYLLVNLSRTTNHIMSLPSI